MGRKREFDDDVVINKALMLFWQRGYHALTIDDVLSAIGLARQSFYNSYSDKRTLLLRCLGRYRQQVLTNLETQLASKATPAAGVAAVFEGIAAEPDHHKRRGCLMISCASELAAADIDVADAAAGFQVAIEDAFAAQLNRGIAELLAANYPAPPTLDDARRKARSLTATYFGLRALAKADLRSTALTDAARSAADDAARFLCVPAEEAPAFPLSPS